MLLSSTEPVVRQFLNAQRVGPIGMAEEKDAAEREAESAAGAELPPLPPIQVQLRPSNGQARRAERVPGQWCAANGVSAPAGSFREEAPV
jgi:phospholipid/cholesterol/gamma-HCH transport system ATP-binding protein